MVVFLECGELYCYGCIGAFIRNNDQGPDFYLEGDQKDQDIEDEDIQIITRSEKW